MAFMDIQPITPGHLLVIPKAHAPRLLDVDPQDMARMMTVAQQLAQALRSSTVPAEGINLWLADGEVALQSVFHTHLHVIPRNTDDGFFIGGDFHDPGRPVLDGQADDIRRALAPSPELP